MGFHSQFSLVTRNKSSSALLSKFIHVNPQLSSLNTGAIRVSQSYSTSALNKRYLQFSKQDVSKLLEAEAAVANLGISQNLRCFSATTMSNQQAKPQTKSSSSSLTESNEKSGAITMSMGEKVKENAKTVSYGGVILVGVGIGGAMLYVLLGELFSANSPNNIYSHSFKLCKLSTEVQDALGTPIKCYGEETRRGWRRHVACNEFLVGDTKYLRMRFYIEGQFHKGTVHLEKKMPPGSSKYEYNYLIVDVDGYPPRRINVDF